jgi:hypothetical protein
MSERDQKILYLAMRLYTAANKEKRRQGERIWGQITNWDNAPTETQDVWYAVAMQAAKEVVSIFTGK